MKLIDADELKKQIIELKKVWDSDTLYGGGRIDSYMRVIKTIDNLPPVYTLSDHNITDFYPKTIIRQPYKNIKIEVTENHTFAKPDDVNEIDFPNSNCSEDK